MEDYLQVSDVIGWKHPKILALAQVFQAPLNQSLLNQPLLNQSPLNQQV